MLAKHKLNRYQCPRHRGGEAAALAPGLFLSDKKQINENKKTHLWAKQMQKKIY